MKMPSYPPSGQVAFYSMLLNIGLTVAKGALSLLTGSTALLAETIHSLTDLVASLATFIGIRISRLKNREFPYGLYKSENLAALISSGLIFLAGYEILREGLSGKPALTLHRLPLAIGGLLFILLVIYLFSSYEARRGEELNSPALKADAYHLRTDLSSTLVVLSGLLGAWLGYPGLDRLATVIVVFFIARAGWEILLDAMRTLLDASVDHQTLDLLRGIVQKDPRVRQIKTISARNSGSVIFVTMDVALRVRELNEAHRATEEIEKALRQAVPRIEQVLIHYEPAQPEYLTIAVPLADRDGRISEHYGEAPFVALVKLRSRDLVLSEQTLLINPFQAEEKGKGIKLTHFLLERGVDLVFSRETLAGKGPAYLFEAAGVDFRATRQDHLDELLRELAAAKKLHDNPDPADRPS